MKHTYLSVDVITEALTRRAITEIEAKRLLKKIDCQKTIYKTIKR
jgi:hypothetical protein